MRLDGVQLNLHIEISIHPLSRPAPFVAQKSQRKYPAIASGYASDVHTTDE